MNIKNHLYSVLRADKRVWVKNETENPELNQTRLIDLAEKYDENILSLLFSNQDLKDKFFQKINDTHIFKVRDFVFFLEENKINNSYTQLPNTKTELVYPMANGF